VSDYGRKFAIRQWPNAKTSSSCKTAMNRNPAVQQVDFKQLI